jgi:hypothetical protein
VRWSFNAQSKFVICPVKESVLDTKQRNFLVVVGMAMEQKDALFVPSLSNGIRTDVLVVTVY